MPISNRPWSQFQESDYDLDQWHRACLIHLHDGPPTAKAQCKLPVREPDGTLKPEWCACCRRRIGGRPRWC
jgi:hypothetical protein